MSWRTGSKVPFTLYDGERFVGSVRNAGDATIIASGMNELSTLRARVEAAEAGASVAIAERWAAEDKFKGHTEAVGLFLSEMYQIMVDPLDEGVRTIAETTTALKSAALRERETVPRCAMSWRRHCET